MPHRQLFLRITTVWPPRRRVPSPDFEWVDAVELPRPFSSPDCVERTLEIPIDVVRMILVFRERAVRKNFVDTDLPELPGENLEVVD
jgi:hypothetical protein